MTRRLYRDGALADGRSDRLQLGVSILAEDGRITWIRPSDDEGPHGDRGSLEVVDASGSTIVPGMVDAHSHLTMPGGAHWIDRAADPTERLLDYAEANARLLTLAGVRWARDVGSVRRPDPAGGRERALALGVRDRWRDRAGYPRVRAAGTWIMPAGLLPDLSIQAGDPEALVAAAMEQLDDGADLVKLYLDGTPDAAVCPWTVDEVRRVVQAAHARGARVTAHAGFAGGARVGAEAGVDALEHGFELDDGTASIMARAGVRLVSTLSVMASWETFGHTTAIPRFTTPEGRSRYEARRERAVASVAAAHRAGVAIAAGTDFGGGSTRANQLAWEVELLVGAGLEPWEALGSVTWRGGELLGEPDAGVLREGGPADLVLVHGDPLSDARALWRAWHASWSG